MAAALSSRLSQLDDERLARLVRQGDEAAFEALYDRHRASLLAFCRHMAGNREDGEDALQQTFLRAHRALRAGRPPDTVRPWLFAIARNRCRTLIAARRDLVVAAEDIEPSYDGLAEDVSRRADLRELVADLGRLPEDQRGALVLFELGGLDQAQIATVIGCPPGKVKALVYQARSELIAERDARSTPCDTIRLELSVARGGALRRGPLRRHLRGCDGCREYRELVTAQRAGLATILPVAPSAALKATTLASLLGGAPAAGHGAGGAGGAAASGAGASSAAATSGAAGTASAGGASSGATLAGASAGGATGGGLGGLAVSVSAKVAIGVALAGAAVAGGLTVQQQRADRPGPVHLQQTRAVVAAVRPAATRAGAVRHAAVASATPGAVATASPRATPFAPASATAAATPAATAAEPAGAPAPAPAAAAGDQPAAAGGQPEAAEPAAPRAVARPRPRPAGRQPVVVGSVEVVLPAARQAPSATPGPRRSATGTPTPAPRPRTRLHPRPRPGTGTPAPVRHPRVLPRSPAATPAPRPRPRVLPRSPAATPAPRPRPRVVPRSPAATPTPAATPAPRVLPVPTATPTPAVTPDPAPTPELTPEPTATP